MTSINYVFRVTGLGNFGIKGIQDFVDNHECSLVCGSLGFLEKSQLQKSVKAQSKKVKNANEDGEFENEEEESLVIKKPTAAPGATDSDDKNISDKGLGGPTKNALVDY